MFFQLKNNLIHFTYVRIFKPIFFAFDPEFVHDHMLKNGQILGSNFITRGLTSFLFKYSNSKLTQTIKGITFTNPIGLSAGFDKNGVITNILPSVGFGFAELGTITAEPYAGNPKPRLTRLKKSQSIVVNYGLANQGSKKIAHRLEKKKFSIPIGISVGPTNSVKTAKPEAAINDYLKTIKTFQNIGSYFTLNISCPNTLCDQPFTDPKLLDLLLKKVMPIVGSRMVLIKLSPDLALDRVGQLVDVAQKYRVAGFICGNLTKNRTNPKIKDKNVPKEGGLSGKPTEDLSNRMIGYIYQKTRGKILIIGCGGVFTAQDAYQKIKLGTSLIQLITGMIYEGPQLIGGINYGLTKLLKKDGFTHISQAVGKENNA